MRLYRAAIQRYLYSRDSGLPGGSAIVFAPHQDDETLGCGGVIIEKRRQHVPVHIVYMTDGSRSNDVLNRETLRELRAQEATASAAVLGVAAEALTFLNFPDGNLEGNRQPAERVVRDILVREKCCEVFLPCAREDHADHVATHDIVWSAIHSSGLSLTVYEYAVHFWSHWPLIDNSPRTSIRNTLRVLRQALASALYLFKHFNRSVFIGDVVALKRRSLEQHKSQMTRLVPDPRWAVLPEAGNGEWLELFFQDHEVFSCETVRS